MSLIKILVYGFGNPGRQDDGLGAAFADALEEWVSKEGKRGFSFDSNYQLNIEDAEAISGKDLVIFVDSSMEPIEDFILTPVYVDKQVSFTSHAASPGYVFDLCRQIYGHAPATYLLHIKGHGWGFEEGLTRQAGKNLEKALNHMKTLLQQPDKLIEEFKYYESV